MCRLTSAELRCYFVFRCDFVNPSPAEDESDLKVVSDRKFLEKVSANTLAIYQEVMNEVMKRTGPVRQLDRRWEPCRAALARGSVVSVARS